MTADSIGVDEQRIVEELDAKREEEQDDNYVIVQRSSKVAIAEEVVEKEDRTGERWDLEEQQSPELD